jgi:hypothetical protein
MISGHSSALSCMLGPVVSCLRHFSIVMVQTSEDGKSYHLGSGLRSDTRCSSGVWNLLLDALMGSLCWLLMISADQIASIPHQLLACSRLIRSLSEVWGMFWSSQTETQ